MSPWNCHTPMRPCHHPLLGCQHLEREYYPGGCVFAKRCSLSRRELQLRRPFPFHNGFFFSIPGKRDLKKRRPHRFDHDHENGIHVPRERNRHRVEVDETRTTSLYPCRNIAYASRVLADLHQAHSRSPTQAFPNAIVWCDHPVRRCHGDM